MSELPNGWAKCSLSDISTIVTGKTPSKKIEANFGGDIPFIKPGDVTNQGLITGTEESLSELGATTVPTIPAGSITVTCIGNLGRTAITKSLSATNQQINSTIPSKSIHTKYLYYYLQTMKAWMDAESSSTTVAIINKTRFSAAPIILAPLNEQIRIANKLDSILAKVDKAQARLDKIPAILKRFRQSVLAAATSGELTKEWREENQLEFHMVEKRFEELLIELRNGISTKPNENGVGYPILRISAVRAGIVTQEDVRHLECDSKIVEKYKLLPNDILFTRYNGSLDFVGVCGLLKTLRYETLLYPDKLIRARVTEEVLPEFIEIYFSSPDTREAMISHVKTTSGQKGISGKDIKNQIVRFPTLLEQKQVVSRVSALLAKASKVEKQYLDAKARLDRLTQSILAKAFRGELVPQDPNDEPAEKLLERILAEKELNKPKKTTRKRATKSKTAEKE